MQSVKVYVEVTTAFDPVGRMTPLSLRWEDGREYPIDRVTDVRPATAMKSGGQGDRFTVRIKGQESYLFFERSPNLHGNTLGRWFVERR